MDKTTQWKIQEILKKVTPLDFQPVLCVCGNDTYAKLSQFQYLPALHKDNDLGHDITVEKSTKVCTQCGRLFGAKDESNTIDNPDLVQ